MTIAEQLTILNNNLDAVGTETDTQSDIIDEIMEALEGKATGGEASHMISISVGELTGFIPAVPSIYYLDQNGGLNAAPSSSSINALYGIVIFDSSNYVLGCTGDYVQSNFGVLQTVLFKSNGGSISVVGGGSI